MRYKENDIIISEEELTGDLRSFPLEVVCRMIYNAALQGNSHEKSKRAFIQEVEADRRDGGFNWHRSLEGFDFWNDIIVTRNFKRYFDKYPECRGEYIIEESDYFVWIRPKMPHELIQLTIRTAIIQDRRNQLRTSSLLDCFVWDATIQEQDFWSRISQGDYSVFTSSIKTDKNEIKLQRKKSTVIRGVVPKGCILCGKNGKSSITVGPLGFRECIGH